MVRSLNSIAAVCQNMGIGKNGQLPWPPLRNEFKYFQKMTMTPTQEDPTVSKRISRNEVFEANAVDYIRRRQVAGCVMFCLGENPSVEDHRQGKQNVVIMGKRTWFSIPEKFRPLKGRINIVLSKEMKEIPKGAHYMASSLDEALDLLESSELASKIDLVWIVGGSSVYKAAMEKPVHHLLFVTRILHDFESDTFFPEIDLEKYKLLPSYAGVPSDVQEENGIQYKFEVYEKNV